MEVIRKVSVQDSIASPPDYRNYDAGTVCAEFVRLRLIHFLPQVVLFTTDSAFVNGNDSLFDNLFLPPALPEQDPDAPDRYLLTTDDVSDYMTKTISSVCSSFRLCHPCAVSHLIAQFYALPNTSISSYMLPTEADGSYSPVLVSVQHYSPTDLSVLVPGTCLRVLSLFLYCYARLYVDSSFIRYMHSHHLSLCRRRNNSGLQSHTGRAVRCVLWCRLGAVDSVHRDDALLPVTALAGGHRGLIAPVRWLITVRARCSDDGTSLLFCFILCCLWLVWWNC